MRRLLTTTRTMSSVLLPICGSVTRPSLMIRLVSLSLKLKLMANLYLQRWMNFYKFGDGV
jgi:hypothetical protein